MSNRRARRALILPLLTCAVFLAGCGGTTATSTRTLDDRLLGPSVAARRVSEATSAVARCRVDGDVWKECGSPFVAFDLAPGPHTIDVEAQHGGIALLRRPADTTGDRLAVVAFANTGGGPSRRSIAFTVAGAQPGGSIALAQVREGSTLRGLVNVGAGPERGPADRARRLLRRRQGGRLCGQRALGRAARRGLRVARPAHAAGRRRVARPASPRLCAARDPRGHHAHLHAGGRRARRPAGRDRDARTGRGHAAPAGGRFPISDFRLGAGVHLIGAGTGKTVLVAPAGAYQDAIEVTGDNVLISDLSVDASGSGSTPDESAAILVRNADDVVLRRLKMVHIKGYGVQILGHHQRISVQQSSFDGDGRANIGVAEWSEDASSSDVSVVRSVLRGFHHYGVLLQSFFNGHTWPTRDRSPTATRSRTSTTRRSTTARSRSASGSPGRTPRRRQPRPRHGLGRDRDRRQRLAPDHCGNVVRDTMTGIYIENVTRDALIEQNDIAGVSVAGINLEPPHGGPQSGRLTIRANRVVGAGVYGIGSGPGTLGNRITGNIVLDSAKYAILLDGASGNVVSGNDLRDRRTPSRQTWCVYDPQTRGSKTSNTVQDNDCTGSANGGSGDAAAFSARRGQTP